LTSAALAERPGTLAEAHDRDRKRRALWLAGLGASVPLLIALHLFIGPVPLTVGEVANGFPAWLGLTEDGASGAVAIVYNIRLPRALTALAVGATLSLAGAVLQALFRNPLADPGLVGVSSAAAVGAVTAIVFGLAGLSFLALPVAAFLGALTVGAIILMLASRPATAGMATLLLAGIAINAIAGALLGVLIYVSSDTQLRELNFWMLGSFAAAHWQSVTPALVLMSVAGLLLLRRAGLLDALLLGERSAYAIGVDTGPLKRRLILLTTLGIGAAVSVSGTIGFVGLVVPHLVRLAIGARHALLLPASALLGGSLMLAADLVAKLAVAPAELPIGLVTSLVGGPFFFWLVLTRSQGGRT